MKIILLAIRSLMRFRLYTVINVLGLALSLACVIIISRYVYSEATTDHFNTNHERIYLSVRQWESGVCSQYMCFEFVLIYLYFDIAEGDKGGSFLYFRYIQGIDIVLFQYHIICCK